MFTTENENEERIRFIWMGALGKGRRSDRNTREEKKKGG